VPQNTEYSYLSPYFDESSNNIKVRSRGFLEQSNVDESPWSSVSPVYEVIKSERPTDDTRFSIEFSLVDTINKDIMTMFSTLDAIDNAIGSPELIFSPDYPDLDNLQEIYFNRLSDKLNFKAFHEFYRWFDSAIGMFIQQLVPRRSRFNGMNFVIESHVFERHKLQYQYNEMYLGDSERSRIRDVLLLQQLEAAVRKY